MRIKFLVSSLIIIFFTAGCVSAKKDRVVLEDVENSLADIKKVTGQIIGGIRLQSENGRELFSKYFNVLDETDFTTGLEEERAYTKVVILGDRRPYDIEVMVYVEKKEKGQFVQQSTDISLARKKLKIIRQKLNESLGKRNVIDDFKAF